MRAIFYVCALLLCATPALAQEAPTPPLRWSEALTIALRRDARAAAAVARVRAAEARRAEASLGALPDVLVGAGLTAGFAGSGSNLQLRGMLGSPFFRTWVVGVDASWNVIDLLRARRASAAAEAATEAASAGRELARREVALALVDLFEQVLASGARRGQLDAEVQARSAQLTALQARAEAGTLAADQPLLSAAALADANAELQGARAEERGARAALHALIGDPRAWYATLALDTSTPADDAPDAHVARALRRQADEVRSLRALELAPRVTLGGSVGYANPAPGADPGYYALGAAVALPLTAAVRERARRDAEIAALEVGAAQSEAAAEEVARRLIEIDASIAVLEAALPSAEAARRAADDAAEGLGARAAAGTVAGVEVEQATLLQRRARARELGLQVRLAGLRTRRSLLAPRGWRLLAPPTDPTDPP